MNKDDVFNQYEFVMFFNFKNKLYGSDEESRILFAKMKNPKDKDKIPEFEGYDLEGLVNGHNTPTTFTKEDIKNVKIIDEEEARKKIDKFKPKNTNKEKDSPPGVIRLDQQ